MSTKPGPYNSIIFNLVVPIIAATGAFLMTLVLRDESAKTAFKEIPSKQNQGNKDHENLDVAKAQALAEKLSSHVSIPAPLT